MGKVYPLEIQEYREFEGGHLGWYSKGHHNVNNFVLEVELGEYTAMPLSPDGCRHEWWRCVPIGAGYQGALFVAAKPGTRGAFPVTVYEEPTP